MKQQYKHLTFFERNFIHRSLNEKRSYGWIGKALGRSPSTISREVRKNGLRDGYDAGLSSSNACLRRRQGLRKLAEGTALRDKVIGELRLGWSPQQISGRLTDMDPETGRVSHETIYRMLYVLPRGQLRKELIGFLRRGQKERLPRTRGKDRRGGLVDMKSIHDRPEEVEKRLIPGHWEGDLIKGAGNATALGVLYERTSRYVILTELENCSAQAALESFSRAFGGVPPLLRKTLTYDQGKEMARHAELAKRMEIEVYFCDPHSPWQRAGCENINGLIRQYFPKGTDFSIFSQDDFDKVAASLNGRPRKTLDFKTPAEVMDIFINSRGVALQS
jgi:transposase, IS30 family